MARCSNKKTHFPTKYAAHRRLDWINEHPDPTRAYAPTNVIPCHCGEFVLTSSRCKPKAKGKSQRGGPRYH